MARYTPLVRSVVRRWLHRGLRGQFDPDDFVQDIWTAFFTRSLREQTFESPNHLTAFLRTMARNKVVGTYRQRRQYQKYAVGREQRLDDSSVKVDLIDPHLPPDAEAVAHDQLHALLKRLSWRDQLILVLRAEEESNRSPTCSALMRRLSVGSSTGARTG